MQAFKRPSFWAYPVLAVGLWAFFAFAMPDVLEFWEKNQLFRFSSDYWHFFDHEPFGTLIYLHTFLIQFSYYPWLGAIVYALLFTLTAFLFNRCLSINGNRYLLPGLLAVALLLPTTVNFGLLVLMVVFLAVIGAHLWIYWEKRILRYICQIVVLAALTFLVREYMAWILPFYICLDWRRNQECIDYAETQIERSRTMNTAERNGTFIKRPVENQRNNQKFKYLFLLIPIGGTAIFWFLESWYCTPYEFIFPKKLFLFTGQCFSPTASTPYLCFSPDKKVFFGMGIFAIVSLFLTFLRTKKTRSAWIIGLLLVAGGAWITRLQARPVVDFQKVDRLCHSYRWGEALHKINAQWERTKPVNDIKKDVSHSQILLCGHTRTALLATRKATSTLFTYPHPFFPLLFPIDLINHPESLTLPAYYTYIGGFSESLHIDYDFITGHCISANILNHVIITSLIVDDTIPMLKFVNFLQHSLFYRNQAAVYLNTEARLKLPQVMRGKTMLPSHNYTVWGYKPDENAVRQHLHQPDNIYFYEYFLTISLLHKKHSIIKDEMPKIKRFYPHAGRYIAPRHIQEALLADYNYVPMRLAYPVYIEGVDNSTWQDYWHFLSDNEAFQSGRQPFSELLKKWGHTYWFYDCYMKIVHFNNNDNRQIN